MASVNIAGHSMLPEAIARTVQGKSESHLHQAPWLSPLFGAALAEFALRLSPGLSSCSGIRWNNKSEMPALQGIIERIASINDPNNLQQLSCFRRK